MDWLQILGKIDNIAVIVLLVLYITERKENRADRQALLDLLHKNTDALNNVRNAISAITGKPIV